MLIANAFIDALLYLIPCFYLQNMLRAFLDIFQGIVVDDWQESAWRVVPVSSGSVLCSVGTERVASKLIASAGYGPLAMLRVVRGSRLLACAARR